MTEERDPESTRVEDEEQPEDSTSPTPTPDESTGEVEKPEENVVVPITTSFDNEKPTLDFKEDKWARLTVGESNSQEAGVPQRSLQPSPDLRERNLPPIPNDYARSDMGDSTHAEDDGVAPPTPLKDSPKVGTVSRTQSTLSNTPTNIPVAVSRTPVNGQTTLNSTVFVIQALETISTSKEARRRKYLGTACQEALGAIKAAAPHLPLDPEVVFEPLRMACETHNVQITTIALDTIGKLISYSYFSVAPAETGTPPRTPVSSEDAAADTAKSGQQQQPKLPLIERSIETICECFQGDGTADQVQLQIIKALLAAVLNDKAVVHGAGLIKAIRQTYNIFLLSKSSPNQMTAQGTLTQMVHTVFERVKTRMALKESQLSSTGKANASSTTINIPTPGGGEDEPSSAGGGDGEESTAGRTETCDEHQTAAQEKITLQSFENRKSFDDGRIADTTTVTRSSSVDPHHKAHRAAPPDGTDSQAGSEAEDEDEVFVKDAFVVFRSMCKLSDKSISADQLVDVKSNGMRSKLLSLHLIHTILKTHMTVFTNHLVTIRSSSKNEPTRFIHAVKQYLCLSLSRNAASAAGLVFEVCCEIFWLVIREMRVMMKVSKLE